MKLRVTKLQRMQVVELLRCAAALESCEKTARGSFPRSAVIQLSAPAEIEDFARLACCYVCGDGTSLSVQLAAAAHVESGDWPRS